MEKHIEPHVAREQVESKAKEEKLIDRWMKIKIDQFRCQYTLFYQQSS